jgi:hypothetical protein
MYFCFALLLLFVIHIFLSKYHQPKSCSLKKWRVGFNLCKLLKLKPNMYNYLKYKYKPTTIQTIYWGFLVTCIINSLSRTSFILIAFTRRNHTINTLTSVAQKAVAIPPKVVMAVGALAAHDAVRVC